MDKRPFTDHSILLPIGISVFSIAGILIVFLAVLLDQLSVGVTVTPTTTPFTYLLIAPETPLPGPVVEAAPPGSTFLEEPAGSPPLETPQVGFTPFPTEAFSQATQPVNNTLSGTTNTPVTSTAVLNNITNRYDDPDPLFEYDGDWDHQTNVGNAYQRTLSVSNTIDSDLIFDFTGRQIIIGYLGGSGQGTLTIYIDDDEFQLNQSAGKEWTSPQFSNEEHFVIIVHENGDSVNLDYISILGSE